MKKKSSDDILEPAVQASPPPRKAEELRPVPSDADHAALEKRVSEVEQRLTALEQKLEQRVQPLEEPRE